MSRLGVGEKRFRESASPMVNNLDELMQSETCHEARAVEGERTGSIVVGRRVGQQP